MFWDCLSIQLTCIVFFFQTSVGSDSDLNENEKEPYQQSVQGNEIDICEEILKDVDTILNEFPEVPEFNFPADTLHFDFDPNPMNNLFSQLTHQFNRISIPISSTNLFFQLAYQFKLISIPIPSTKVLLMYLITIPLALHLIICLCANQLIYQKTVRRKILQGHKSKNQKGMPKNPCFSTV